MAGHNKWSKIKHKKAATDAQKSKVFGKFAMLLTSEARKCSGDKNSPALKSLIDQAKAVNMSNQNIDQAIQRGVKSSGEGYETVIYEAFGPGGVALIIKAETANRNKTAAEIRHILSKNNCTLSPPGSVMWMFEQEKDQYQAKILKEITEKEEEEKIHSVIKKLEEQLEVQEVVINIKQEG